MPDENSNSAVQNTQTSMNQSGGDDFSLDFGDIKNLGVSDLENVENKGLDGEVLNSENQEGNNDEKIQETKVSQGVENPEDDFTISFDDNSNNQGDDFQIDIENSNNIDETDKNSNNPSNENNDLPENGFLFDENPGSERDIKDDKLQDSGNDTSLLLDETESNISLESDGDEELNNKDLFNEGNNSDINDSSDVLSVSQENEENKENEDDFTISFDDNDKQEKLDDEAGVGNIEGENEVQTREEGKLLDDINSGSILGDISSQEENVFENKLNEDNLNSEIQQENENIQMSEDNSLLGNSDIFVSGSTGIKDEGSVELTDLQAITGGEHEDQSVFDDDLSNKSVEENTDDQLIESSNIQMDNQSYGENLGTIDFSNGEDTDKEDKPLSMDNDGVVGDGGNVTNLGGADFTLDSAQQEMVSESKDESNVVDNTVIPQLEESVQENVVISNENIVDNNVNVAVDNTGTVTENSVNNEQASLSQNNELNNVNDVSKQIIMENVDGNEIKPVKRSLSLDQILDSELENTSQSAGDSNAVTNDVPLKMGGNKKLVGILAGTLLFLLAGFVVVMAFPGKNLDRKSGDVVEPVEEHYIEGRDVVNVDENDKQDEENNDNNEENGGGIINQTAGSSVEEIDMGDGDDVSGMLGDDSNQVVLPYICSGDGCVEESEPEEEENTVIVLEVGEILPIISDFKSQAENYYIVGDDMQDKKLMKYATKLIVLCDTYQSQIDNGEGLDSESFDAFVGEAEGLMSDIGDYMGWSEDVEVFFPDA